MKTKPLTTGKFSSRQILEKQVLRRRKAGMKLEDISDEVGACTTVVGKICRENPKYERYYKAAI